MEFLRLIHSHTSDPLYLARSSISLRSIIISPPVSSIREFRAFWSSPRSYSISLSKSVFFENSGIPLADVLVFN